MKYALLFIITLLIITCTCCKTTTQVHNEPVLFDFPDNMKLNESEKTEFTHKIEKGARLYQLTCAGCHNKIIDGKSTIPDFSLPQLMDYEMRIQYPSHQDRLREVDITADELDMVVSFLRYRKKTGANIQPG